MILDDVITDVRFLLQDETEAYRFSDATLLGLANQTLGRICVLRPDLFITNGTVTCTQGEVRQSAPSDSMRLVEVCYIVSGNVVKEVSRETMDQNEPGWVAATEAAATNWMRNVRSPNSFFIYPPAPAAQVLDVEYVQSPATYLGTATVALLPDSYFSTVVDGTVFLAESIDNEHVTTGRAELFLKSFASSLSVSLEGRAITDTERSGMPETEEVV